MSRKQRIRNKFNHYEIKQQQNTTTQHHILNRCKRDLFNVFEKGNTTPLLEKDHRLRHALFHNSGPKEVLQQIKRMTQVMHPHAKRLYEELCGMSDEEFYAPKYVRKKR